MRDMPLDAGSRSPWRRSIGGAAAGLLLAATVTACGDDPETPGATEPESQSVESESPSPSPSEDRSQSPSPSPSKTKSEDSGPGLEVEVEGDEVKPVAEQVDLAVGERLTITVESDRAGELHVHSSPEQFADFEAGASELDFTFDKPGSVDIEEHESGALIVRVLVQ